MEEKLIDVLYPTKNGYTIKKIGDKRMMDKKKGFDDYFPDWVFAIPRPSHQPKVKLRALFDYCKQKDCEPEDLTEKEMEQFLERG